MSRTISDVMTGLGLKGWNGSIRNAILEWPPDVFAAATVLLRDSGAYLECLNPCAVNPPQSWGKRDEWEKRIRSIGEAWGKVPSNVPAEVRASWNVLERNKQLDISEIRSKGLWSCLVELAAMADEACFDTGMLPEEGWEGDPDVSFLDSIGFQSRLRLLETLPLRCSTLCRHVHPSAGVVLPKMRTPQSGITIRSMSHHLAFFESREMKPLWLHVPDLAPEAAAAAHDGFDRESGRYNILGRKK